MPSWISVRNSEAKGGRKVHFLAQRRMQSEHQMCIRDSFYGKRYSNTDPQRRTDFVKLAEAFGAKGYRATNIAEFKAAFADADVYKRQGNARLLCCQQGYFGS